MKYVCPICGYVYDEAKEKVPFSALPESWTCPLCGAGKSVFTPQNQEKETKPGAPVHMDGALQKLGAGELAALFSNLARGCEKQYKAEERALFAEIADYFTAAAPELPDADLAHLAALLQGDLTERYGTLKATAEEAGDRGTQRICVWGEKVTRILESLLSRYQREGEAFLRNTSIWVCTVCGFVWVGDTPPDICPVCKVPDWKFEKIEGRASS